jgi:hypothetical protein
MALNNPPPRPAIDPTIDPRNRQPVQGGGGGQQATGASSPQYPSDRDLSFDFDMGSRGFNLPGRNPQAFQTPTMGLRRATNAPDMSYAQSPGIAAANQRVGGNLLAQDPALASAMAAMQANILPGIQNQAAQAGLHRSTTPLNIYAKAQAQQLTPLIQDAFGREQHAQDRAYGATEEELGRRERADVRFSEAQDRLTERLLGLDQQSFGQEQSALESMFRGGASRRDIGQARNDSYYNNFLRLFDQSQAGTTGLFGSMLPGALGSRVSSSK